MTLSSIGKEDIRRMLLETGAVAAGFARASAPDDGVAGQYARWLADGCHAGMRYMERHEALRRNPENVLPGVTTVISMAFSFNPAVRRDDSLPKVAAYAYGLDYHDVVRSRIRPVAESMASLLGGDWRICIDSAPLPERYWAMRAGIGTLGLNGAIIIDGFGSRVFLAELLTTVAIDPDEPSFRRCPGCGECVRRCPGGALREDATVDCRRCLSYYTIEHRGPFPPDIAPLCSEEAGNVMFGCDVCLDVCPLNRHLPPSAIEEFAMLPAVASLSRETVAALSPSQFSTLFKGSPIKRCRLEGLRRNSGIHLSDSEKETIEK